MKQQWSTEKKTIGITPRHFPCKESQKKTDTLAGVEIIPSEGHATGPIGSGYFLFEGRDQSFRGEVRYSVKQKYSSLMIAHGG